MHKNKAKIENPGNFSLKILGIFVSLRREWREIWQHFGN